MEENKLNEEVTEVKAEENTEVLEETEVVEENGEAAETTEAVEEKAPYDGPTVVVSTRYDYKTLKYYNVMSMVYKRHYPVLYLVLALFCIIYDAFTIYSLAKAGALVANKLLMPAIFVIFAGYSIYLFFNFEKSIDKNLTMHFNQSPDVSSVQTKVTLEGITVTSSKAPENPYFYDWVYITQIIEINQYYYFFAGRQPIILSKDVNNILEGDAETLRSMIEEQIAIKPYKKIEKEILKTPITYVHPCDVDGYTTVQADAQVVEPAEAVEEVVEEENKQDNE